MKNLTEYQKRKIGTLLTILNLIIIPIIFEYGIKYEWVSGLIIFEVVLVLSLIIGIYLFFFKNGLWNYSHADASKLDERERTLVNESLNQSYSIFSISVLILLLFISLTKAEISIVSVFAFILFAHLLPSSIIGWKERHLLN